MMITHDILTYIRTTHRLSVDLPLLILHSSRKALKRNETKRKRPEIFTSMNMSETCVVSLCEQPSFTVCHCCERSMCKLHLSEHNNFLADHWNPLVNEIKALDESIKAYDATQATSESTEKLEQWRVKCHEKIDQLFDKKNQELTEYLKLRVEQQTQNVQQLQEKLPRLIDEKQVTLNPADLSSLILTVDQLKRDMLHIQQAYVQIRCCPLIVEDSMLQIIETIRPLIDLSNFPAAFKTFEHSNKSFCVLTSNDKHLLIHQGSDLCLINEEMKLVHKTLWPFENLIDLCWSATLEQYVFINDHNLFLINDMLTRVEQIPTRQNCSWLSCICSDNYLFVSTNEQTSSIFVFQLLPTIKFNKRWQYPAPNGTHEQIDSMAHNNETLGLVIRNWENKNLRFELRFASTFDCLWSLPLDIVWVKKIPFRCSVMSFDEWLICDYQNDALIHISKSGQIKSATKYPVTAYHAHLFRQYILVVMTKTGKNFHRFGSNNL